MNDFAKTKITVALALAGIALAINPLVTSDEVKDVAVSGFPIQLYYYIFITVLGISIYAYAWDFVSEKSYYFLHKAGGFFYAFALVIPLAVILIWIADIIFKNIPTDKKSLIENLGMGLSVTVGIVSGLISKRISKKTQEKEEQKTKDFLADFIISYLQKIERRMVSFRMLRRKTGLSYTDEWFESFIKEYAELFQKAKLKGGIPGVKYEKKKG